MSSCLFLKHNSMYGYLICVYFCRLKSEHSREAVRTHEDIESQRKQTEDMQEMLRKQEDRAGAARRDLER